MKNKVHTFSIRIISLISCIMVLITSLIVPAAATSTDSSEGVSNQNSLVDLLTAKEYWVAENDVYSSTTLESPVSYSNGSTNIKFDWTGDRTKSNGIYIGVRSTKTPASVQFKPYAAASYRSMELVNYFGNLWFYYLEFTGTVYDMSVSISYSSAYSGNIALVYAYTQVQDVINFDRLGLYVYDKDKYGDGYTNILSFGDGVNLPYSHSFSDDDNLGVEVMMNISPNPNELLVADSITILFSTTGIVDAGSFVPTLYTSGGTLKSVLPYSLIGGYGNATTTIGDNKLTHTIYSMTIYTNDVDLQDCIIRVRFFMTTTKTDTGGGVYFAINGACAKIPVFEIPWYQRMFYWIQDEFILLSSNITSQFSYLKIHLTNKFGELFINLTNHFTSLEETINSALGVGTEAPDTSDQESAVQDSIDDMDGMSDEFADAQEEMDELMPSMPSWEDTGLDGFDDTFAACITDIRAIFLAIYANSIINQILTFTFLFALGGFILFGER